ncbi:MAG: response regulator [Pseudomonadales bacterium]
MNWNSSALVHTAEGRIIVIDGDPAIRDSLATLLALDNHPIQIFATGGEFLKTIDNSPIACLACETDLPDGSGYALIDQVRGRHPSARLALLTSRKDRNVMARAQASGVSNVFFKPLIQQSLIDFLTDQPVNTEHFDRGVCKEPL